MYQVLKAADYLDYHTLIDSCLRTLILVISGLSTHDLIKDTHLKRIGLISPFTQNELYLKLNLTKKQDDQYIYLTFNITSILNQINLDYGVPVHVTIPVLYEFSSLSEIVVMDAPA